MIELPKNYASYGTIKIAINKGYMGSLRVAPPEEIYKRDVGVEGLLSTLKRWIREKRGVHISVYPNASAWLWSMSTCDNHDASEMKGVGGTDLGWSDHSGPNLSGGWDTYEQALENAIEIQLSYSMEEWEEYRGKVKGGTHISGYSLMARNKHLSNWMESQETA